MGLVLHHFLAANAAWQRVCDLEKAHTGHPFESCWDEIFTSAITGVIAVAAGLEAYINEIFMNRARHFPQVPKGLMDELWTLYERNTVLEKYASAYRLITNSKLDTSRRPAQDVQALLALRNGLVHFKPEWSSERDVHDDISNALQYKVDPSPWFKNDALFPRAWASASCLTWALERSIQFIEEFEEHIGLARKLQPIRARLLQPI
jgi:hypothetical protein